MLRQNLIFRSPAVLYAISLYWASSLSWLPIPCLGFDLQDKLIHALAYALLSLLIYLALTKPTAWVRNPVTWTIVIALCYGASDEWHQHFVDGRSAEWADLVADAVGIVVAQMALHWRRKVVAADHKPV